MNKLLSIGPAAVITGAMVATCGFSTPASAASKMAVSSSIASPVTTSQAEHYLNIITSQTNGVDGKFNYSRIVAAGVPSSMAINFAGYLKASGEKYTAPASVQPAISAYAEKVRPEVVKYATSHNKAIPSIDWGRVARVLGSEVECEAVKWAFLARYPFAYCIPNPDNNGTWLIILY